MFGGGFGQRPAAAGFGQPAAGGFGQPAAPAAGGFGQPAAAGGFGQPQAAPGGFGQPAAGGFGQQPAAGGFGQPAAGGFGQPAAPAAGGFGQPAAGGFGQPAAGGFGQPAAAPGGFGQPAAGGFGQPAAAGGFGQPAAAAGGFGQRPAAGGFGQPAAPGGFGQPAAGGFGQPQAAAGGFGQQPAAGGFGQPAAGGFGQRPAAGGFGQPAAPAAGGFGQPAAGGFGQPAAGGFGQPAAAPGGFGQPAAAAGGFGQRPAAGGFGQPAAGGFGQPAAAGGFGQPQAAAGGFGQQPAAGGFGQPAAGGFGQRPAAGGFGQPAAPAAGGFGQPAAGGFGQPAAGGFGQPAAAPGGFGQPAAAGGFGQPAAGGFGQPAAPAAGGFGQKPGGFGQPAAAGGFGQPAAGGFGQPAAAGGFGQPAAGGFGQPAAGGFGQPAAAGGFGQPAAGGFGQPAAGGGFGQPSAGGFGQQPAAAAGGFGAAPAGGISIAAQQHAAVQAQQFAALPDFNDTPYGNVLMFLPSSAVREELTKPPAKSSGGAHESGRFPSYVRQRPMQLSTSGGAISMPHSTIQHQAATVSLGQSLPASSSTSTLHLMKSPQGLGIGQPSTNQTANTLPAADSEQTPPRRLTLLGNPNSTNLLLPQPTPARTESTYHPTCHRDDYILLPTLATLETLSLAELQAVPRFTVSRKDRKVSIVFLVPVSLVRCEIGDAIELRDDGRVFLHSAEFQVRARVTVTGLTGLTEEELRSRCRADNTLFERYDEDEQTWVYLRYPSNEDQRAAAAADHEVNTPEGSVGASPVGGAPAALLDVSNWSQVPMPMDLAERKPSNAVPPFLPNATSGSSTLPSRGPRATVQVTSTSVRPLLADFELPYALPVPPPVIGLPAALCVVQEQFSSQAPQTLYLNKTKATTNKLRPDAHSPFFLARSFRASWSPSGAICVPLHAAVRDAGTHGAPVAEVRGAPIQIVTPVAPMASSVDAVLKLIASFLVRSSSSKAPHNNNDATVLKADFARACDGTTLSDDKMASLQALLLQIPSKVKEPLARTAQQQAHSLMTLLVTLYGLPEGDVADGNADEERKYLQQLRRRRIFEWLHNELQRLLAPTTSDVSSTTSGSATTSSLIGSSSSSTLRPVPPIDSALEGMLRQRVQEAKELAEKDKEAILARVLSLCGYGRLHNPYVAMAPMAQRKDELSQKIVSLLTGELEPFLRQRLYDEKKATTTTTAAGGAVVTPEQRGATWRQLLNVFLHYGSPTSMPLEEALTMFLGRLSTRGENAFPPFGERLSSDFLRSQRGRDVFHLATRFPDATLLVLQAYSQHGSLSPLALHPCASSYFASDYFCPFLLLLQMRALGLPRSAAYRVAEHTALVGFAEQLQRQDALWYWGVLPLSLIEEETARRTAVEAFVRRGASRPFHADAKRVFEQCGVCLQWLEKAVPESITADEERANAPSMTTLAMLLQSLREFSVNGSN